MRYPAFIHNEPDRHGNVVFGVSFPDFPGVVSFGDTVEEAVTNGGEALSFAVEAIDSEGAKPPTPRSVDEIMADPVCATDSDGAALAWVSV